MKVLADKPANSPRGSHCAARLEGSAGAAWHATGDLLRGSDAPSHRERLGSGRAAIVRDARGSPSTTDRKSTRLNSSHSQISYAVFCLKKKKKITPTLTIVS